MMQQAKETLFGFATHDEAANHSPKAVHPALTTSKPYGYNLDAESRLCATLPRKGVKSKKKSMMMTRSPGLRLTEPGKYPIPLNSLHSYVDRSGLEKSKENMKD